MNDLSPADVEPAPPPTDADLSRVATLAERQRQEEAEAVRLTSLLQQALTALRQTKEVDLPEALRAVGMSGFTLTDGTPVKIEDKFIGNKLTAADGLLWVEEHDGAPLIKTTIEIELDRGDLEEARTLLAELRAHRLSNRFKKLDLREQIAAPTIGAFVRELVLRGDDPPLELLGVYRSTTAVVGSRPRTVELKGLARR
jgi:hypothetical protein